MFEELTKKITDKIEEVTAAHIETTDTSTFGDPMAQTIAWAPCKKGGTNIKSHKLIKQDSFRIEFKTTGGMFIFAGIFIVAGLASAGGILFSFLQSTQKNITDLMPVGFCLIFTLAGLFLLRSQTKPIVFDKKIGFYWKGRKSPDQISEKDKIDYTPLSQIHAIQIISEYIRSDKSSYYSHELNLVLHDGSRLNVIDHGNIKAIRENSTILAAFLGVPVWDKGKNG